MAQVNRIWIQIGQSWADGQAATIGSLQAEYVGTTINTRILGANGFECINSVTNNNQYPVVQRDGGCSIEFYFKDIADLLGRDVYITKVAQGSTRLQYDVTRTDWNTASTGELYDETITAINDSITWMNNRGKSYFFEGVIWDQGEGDSVVLSAANEYQANLISLFDGLKTATGNNNLKFYQYNIIMPPSGNRDYLAEVNTAKLNFTNLDTNNRRLFTPIVTDWNADNIHPSVDGYLSLWDDYQKPLIIADL